MSSWQRLIFLVTSLLTALECLSPCLLLAYVSFTTLSELPVWNTLFELDQKLFLISMSVHVVLPWISFSSGVKIRDWYTPNRRHRIVEFNPNMVNIEIKACVAWDRLKTVRSHKLGHHNSVIWLSSISLDGHGQSRPSLFIHSGVEKWKLHVFPFHFLWENLLTNLWSS